MAVLTIAGGGTGNTGALASDTLFAFETGNMDISTDAGTTYITFQQGEKYIATSGLTVTYRNTSPMTAVFKTMPA